MTDLLEKARKVVDDAKKHRFNATLVYSVYNRIFGLNEKVQCCQTCLLRRERLIRKWLEEQEKPVTSEVPEEPTSEVPEELTSEKRGYNRVGILGGGIVLFYPSEEDVLKGEAVYEDGGRIKAGRYELETGDTLIVQNNGKARIEVNLI